MHVNLLSVVRIELFPFHRQPTDRELPIDQPVMLIFLLYIYIYIVVSSVITLCLLFPQLVQSSPNRSSLRAATPN